MDKIAFVFAGQGAQYVGMGKELYDQSDAARSIMDTAERIRPGTLAQCFNGPEDALKTTLNTQPCVMMLDCACAAAVVEAGITPKCVAGFSLGEVAAAAFSHVMTFEQAFHMVIKRAELMQSCAERHPGSMGAILRLTTEQVQALCASVDQAYPVNYNCLGQTVVACANETFEPLQALVQGQRGRMMKLNVSGAFHSPWMKEASDNLHDYLSTLTLNTPFLPLYANATAQPYESDIAGLLSQQVSSPVLWQKTIENMVAQGVDTFVEVGPGTTLGGLIRKIVTAKVLNVQDAKSLDETIKELS